MRLTRVHSRDDAFSIIRCRDQGCDSWGRTNLQPSGSRHKSMALHRVVQLSSRASQRTQKVQVLGGKSRVFLSEFLLLYPLLPHAQLVWTCGCARGHTDARCHLCMTILLTSVTRNFRKDSNFIGGGGKLPVKSGVRYPISKFAKAAAQYSCICKRTIRAYLALPVRQATKLICTSSLTINTSMSHKLYKIARRLKAI